MSKVDVPTSKTFMFSQGFIQSSEKLKINYYLIRDIYLD